MLHAADRGRRGPTVEDVGDPCWVGADKVASAGRRVESRPWSARAAEPLRLPVRRRLDRRAAHGSGRHDGVDALRLRAHRARIRSSWRGVAEAAGAGEILLTSIDRDGTMEGLRPGSDSARRDAVSFPSSLRAVRAATSTCGGAARRGRFCRGRRQHVPLHATDPGRGEAIILQAPGSTYAPGRGHKKEKKKGQAMPRWRPISTPSRGA